MRGARRVCGEGGRPVVGEGSQAGTGLLRGGPRGGRGPRGEGGGGGLEAPAAGGAPGTRAAGPCGCQACGARWGQSSKMGVARQYTGRARARRMVLPSRMSLPHLKSSKTENSTAGGRNTFQMLRQGGRCAARRRGSAAGNAPSGRCQRREARQQGAAGGACQCARRGHTQSHTARRGGRPSGAAQAESVRSPPGCVIRTRLPHASVR